MWHIKNPRPGVRYILPGEGDPNYKAPTVHASGSITFYPYIPADEVAAPATPLPDPSPVAATAPSEPTSEEGVTVSELPAPPTQPSPTADHQYALSPKHAALSAFLSPKRDSVP